MNNGSIADSRPAVSSFKAVLSIQSHVVYGYAGNTAAVFPLQRLGHEVWAVNTVEFSNHTGFGAWRGRVLETDLISQLVAGLEDRGVLKNCNAVLSGYLGSGETGKLIAQIVKKVRAIRPDAVYCCDPVMGDEGRGFYVKPEIPDIIKNDLIPLADIVCPNQFELQALTGINIENADDALKAVNILHETGPSIVLVTSFKETKGKTGMIASRSAAGGLTSGCQPQVYKTTTPELPLGSNVAGTGDMTTAVFLSEYLKSGNLENTLERCTASIYNILDYSYSASLINNPASGRTELKIIEAQDQLVSPTRIFKAEKIR